MDTTSRKSLLDAGIDVSGNSARRVNPEPQIAANQAKMDALMERARNMLVGPDDRDAPITLDSLAKRLDSLEHSCVSLQRQIYALETKLEPQPAEAPPPELHDWQWAREQLKARYRVRRHGHPYYYFIDSDMLIFVEYDDKREPAEPKWHFADDEDYNDWVLA